MTRTRWLAPAVQERRLPCDLETESPHPSNRQWDFRQALPCAQSPKMYTLEGTGGDQVFKLADDRLIYKTDSDTYTAVIVVQEQLEKSVAMVPRDKVKDRCKQGVSPVLHSQQQSSRTFNASGLFQRRNQRAHN